MPTITSPVQHWGSLLSTHYEGFWIFVNQQKDGCSRTIVLPHRLRCSSPIGQCWQSKAQAIANAQQFIDGGRCDA
ncbi:hypothetical protein H6S82_01110 [Planktothrix sp. FACHB-1355]|uniref:Uncharacterized protein n=1 Tax=Aerosakkonema funiforme FACHB-1375 TaxID=2949571 RepID=A0A926ZJA7_9CYAN|nr:MULTISPECIES: hypothetical protein [Oscillatoriales]MBD2184820.1 hypothetical protein [Aerosakkonema funiforme FACHB-1375]MBD3557468.1 hypothetical protein [Planktothrix sp. FACHB-1355]